jgi:hypothetical protein
MFIRRKHNPSGVVSVQIIDKSSGKYRVLKTIGSSSDSIEVEKLYHEGKKWLDEHFGNRDMFREHNQQVEEEQTVRYLISNIENILLNGTQIILNKVFELTGFNRIDDKILRDLVVARICQPRSKVATVDYLKSHFDQEVELHRIYRYLDKLRDT